MGEQREGNAEVKGGGVGWDGGVTEGEKSAEHEHAHTQHKSITLSCSVFQNKAFHAIKSQDGLSFPLQTVEHF